MPPYRKLFNTCSNCNATYQNMINVYFVLSCGLLLWTYVSYENRAQINGITKESTGSLSNLK